jgi:SAM-dependent methyltransferase
MTDSVLVIATATADSFHEQGYLAANLDVAAQAKEGGDGRRHFDKHGEAEGRLTLTRDFIDGQKDRNRRKYARFAPILNAELGAQGKFRHLGEASAFPVSFGDKPHSIKSYDAESANAGLGEFVQELEANPDKLYLDIGCGFRTRIYENCLYLEVYPSRTADIIMEPACFYPIETGSLDGISCLAVLEHVEKPWQVVEEMRRMLKPGGKVFIDWPFLQPVHGFPSHFYNATRSGLKQMFQDGFEIITLDTFPNQTPDHTVNWILGQWAQSLTSDAARDELMAMTVGDLLKQSPGDAFWSRILAATTDKAKMTYACGNTLIARRNDDPPAHADRARPQSAAGIRWPWSRSA